MNVEGRRRGVRWDELFMEIVLFVTFTIMYYVLGQGWYLSVSAEKGLLVVQSVFFGFVLTQFMMMRRYLFGVKTARK